MNHKNITLYIKAFLLLLLVQSSTLFAQDVEFKAAAPKGVVKGEQFRLSYTLNKQGKGLRLPSDMEGFEILFGPSESSSYSTQIINGKTTSQSSFTYTYILTASEEGTFTIGPASINVDGSNYKSNSLQINVLPPDKDADDSKSSQSPSSSSSVEIKDTDVFLQGLEIMFDLADHFCHGLPNRFHRVTPAQPAGILVTATSENLSSREP